jgi:glutamate synthase (ferredoxin)
VGIETRERDACGIGFVADVEGRPSRGLVESALEALRRVRHRGAVADDGLSGDGAGLLLPVPAAWLGAPGVGMLFVSPGREREARGVVEAALGDEGLDVRGWRAVPVDPAALGARARRSRPSVLQVLLDGPRDDRELRAFRARRRIERVAPERDLGLYVASLSFATVVYKALCAADQLAGFYPDLRDGGLETSFAMFHQRYSTNTSPSWERAQPFRLLAHNGEINTIGGNVLAMRGRRRTLSVPGVPSALLEPAVDETGSDSSMLDEATELLVRGGRTLPHALTMLVPEAWEGDPTLAPEVRDLYRYHACLVEPWDGPAALVFADGRFVGARLDRNGLRPLRYAICDDGLVVCGSEAGIVDLQGRGSVVRGRLGPGQMLVLDTVAREVLEPPEGVRRLAAERPYGSWTAGLRTAEPGAPLEDPGPELLRRQVAFGTTKEEITVVLRPMATEGREPTSSMGDDTAEPPLSSSRRPVFGYVKQRFAQVTNPPIDHLHERRVMSLRTLLGRRAPLLAQGPEASVLVELPGFVLTPEGVRRLRAAGGPFPAAADLDATFAVSEGPAGLAGAIDRLAGEGAAAVEAGVALLLIADGGIGPERAPVPSLLALGAVVHRLVDDGVRSQASIVVDAGDARDVHQVACLLGYGADAVVPRVALETIAELCAAGRIGGDAPGVEVAQARYRCALEEGVRKVMSKMGIATLDAYRGGQVFETVGLDAEVVDRCLTGTPAVLGGRGLLDLGADVLARHAAAFGDRPALENPGAFKHRAGGETHATSPEVVDALHAALEVVPRGAGSHGPAEPEDERRRAAAPVLDRARRGPAPAFLRFAALADARPPLEPRDLLGARPAGPALDLEDVQPAEEIVRRFSAGAMSHGALSAEAHEALAEGLRLIGARANTGEGGEDRSRYRDGRNSAIKQVASARFGVTPEYLAFAEELQIKMAQGSKPGEGGQLPGHKVTEEIARLRHTEPWIPLVSPPPHHDIYSIEDLAQLVYDLRQVNPHASVSVKLVATAGVGVIAVGVAKALADVIHIAGADGGTGASPLSSIKNVGIPWEVGLAEAQRALVDAGLRGRVRLRVDGGMKTGRDVLFAALLGADEVSFGTMALVAQGCIMVRTCHRDTCPTGIATQRPDLRAKFVGTPEQVAAYFLSVAHDVRRLLAGLGFRSFPEAVGRGDLLVRRDGLPGDPGMDVGSLLGSPAVPRRAFARLHPVRGPRSELGDRVADEAMPMLRGGGIANLAYPITNADRSVGAALGGRVAREFGDAHPPGVVRVTLTGQAGQSFGAFLAPGIDLRLDGEANDDVGKGMAGGRIVVRAPSDTAGSPVLLGNAVLYGATGGELYCAGAAGERFAVRNSGASAVVEGVGDHACEYMTGGTVVVLGPVGRNLGAGMSGGRCFVLDPDGAVAARADEGAARLDEVSVEDLVTVRSLLERHGRLTGSQRAAEILAGWGAAGRAFVRVTSLRAGSAVSPVRPTGAGERATTASTG